MRMNCTFIFLLLIFANCLVAQKQHFVPLLQYSKPTSKNISSTENPNLTGVWRGYFVQKDFDPVSGTYVEQRYKYEIQLNLLSNDAIEGVTYSYNTKAFYGKASMHGIFTKKAKSVLIKELKMLELKISGFSEPCLMTCYMDYSKTGSLEVLKGDFTSINIKSKKDCGDGIVYLEKVEESAFEKEDFLLKKKVEPIKPTPPLVKKTTPEKNNAEIKKIIPEANKKVLVPEKQYKPGAEDALLKKGKSIDKKKVESTNEDGKKITPINPEAKKKIEVKEEPKKVIKELKERTNNLVRTIYVDEGDILVELYDNGQIDNDTVSVYHNNQPEILHARLSGKPLAVKIRVSAEDPIHEFVMVADNLGEIPPNTSLMVITAGKKTYELFLTSDLQRNAKIIIEYKGNQDFKKK